MPIEPIGVRKHREGRSGSYCGAVSRPIDINRRSQYVYDKVVAGGTYVSRPIDINRRSQGKSLSEFLAHLHVSRPIDINRRSQGQPVIMPLERL